MTQSIYLSAALGAATTGTAIGYRIDNHDGTTYVAWTQTNVAETDTAGTWRVTQAVTLPTQGGIVYWGLSGTDTLAVQYGPNLADSVVTQLSTGNPITILSTVVGSSISVYRGDTWEDITIPVSGWTLTHFEVIAFIAKTFAAQSDDAAHVYVRSDTGLQRIGGQAAVSSSNGSVTIDSDTQVTVHVEKTETLVVNALTGATWWLIGFDTTPNPDHKHHVAKGDFTVLDYGLVATA